MKSIDTFIEMLTSTISSSNNLTNMYSPEYDPNGIRRNNLKNYLIQLKNENAKYLLLGEAAGYNGCRLSGIPFTSEYLLVNGINIRNKKYFGNNKYKVYNLQSPQKEQSATIVWNTLRELGHVPLLWNALPYHPHKEKNYKSNRTPSNEELNIGKNILIELLKIFSQIQIIAVGNKAESILINMNIDYIDKIRHPANGGRNDFMRGIINNIINQ